MASITELVGQWGTTPNEPIHLVAFGSSNTEQHWRNQGRYTWVDWLAVNLRSTIGRHIAVINQGIGGDSTVDLLNRLDRDVLSLSPQAAIITIGGNDAQQEGITREQYAENLGDICSQMRAHGIQPVLQTYYCPHYEDMPEAFKPKFERLMELERELAEEAGIPLIDQYSHFEPFHRNHPAEYKRLMIDGLHVNHYGQLLMGIIASRYLGLADPEVPGDMADGTADFIGMMRELGCWVG